MKRSIIQLLFCSLILFSGGFAYAQDEDEEEKEKTIYVGASLQLLNGEFSLPGVNEDINIPTVGLRVGWEFLDWLQAEARVATSLTDDRIEGVTGGETDLDTLFAVYLVPRYFIVEDEFSVFAQLGYAQQEIEFDGGSTFDDFTYDEGGFAAGVGFELVRGAGSFRFEYQYFDTEDPIDDLGTYVIAYTLKVW